MLDIGAYVFFSIYGAAIASIFYINNCNRNNLDLLDDDIEPISMRFTSRERTAMDQRFLS